MGQNYRKALEDCYHAQYLFDNLRANDSVSLIDSTIVQLDQAERKLNEETQNLLINWSRQTNTRSV